jgi:hypothetical protein
MDIGENYANASFWKEEKEKTWKEKTRILMEVSRL